MKRYTFFATAAKGLETLLAEELNDLGLEEVKETRSGVYFGGDIAAAYKACLWSRVANRILLQVGEFPVADTDELYQSVKSIDWSAHMTVEQTFAVDASVSGSHITHNQYAALKTKDAIADWFRDREDDRPSVETEQPDLQINLYINRNQAKLYIDLSGTSLHLRGYRTRGSVAPLKETLAAGILYRAKWHKNFSEIHAQGGGFVDFMCGSASLPIEAAMMACDIAPGLGRSYFGFLAWAQHDTAAWKILKDEASNRRDTGLKLGIKILGFDNHRGTLERAQQHVDQAGLQHVISLQHQDVFSFKLDFAAHNLSNKGLVVLNPPYGKRLGEDDDIESLYRAIGGVLKRQFIGWQASIIVDDKDKGKFFGLRANKVHSLFNGALPCKLLHFDVNVSEILTRYRLPKMLDGEDLSESSFGFRNRLKKNRNKLKSWIKQNNIRAYRLYDADLPDYSVAIDVYEADKTLINIQEYEAPKTIDPEKAKLRLREAVTIVHDFFEVDESQIFLKSRRRMRGQSQYEKLSDQKNFHQVREGDVAYWVNLEDYLDTGLFLDHRPIRTRINAESSGKRVLNLFAYTGSITVQAVAGGASESLTLDMSKTYLDWAEKNMQLNGFSGKQHRFLQVDCLQWLERNNEQQPFDLIFLDPPSFSNSKRMADTFDVQSNHVSLILNTIKLLAPGGSLYFSNNLRGFKLDKSALSHLDIEDITDQTIPTDFKQRKHVHRCWLIHASV